MKTKTISLFLILVFLSFISLEAKNDKPVREESLKYLSIDGLNIWSEGHIKNYEHYIL